MTHPRHRAPNTARMDPTSTTIMLATCAFLPLGPATNTGTPTLAPFGVRGLGTAMTMSSKMLDHHNLHVTSPVERHEHQELI
ncbi:hypothetical protein ACFYO7_08990, partial [Nocardia salmonicida]|uniref:hypothetical protein n=1 Tax=Nocardia salmonicida TaxID=53431 RepID=UPI003673E4D4